MSATATGGFGWESATTPEGQRVRDVFDLHELGVELYKQRLRREHPAALEAEIASMTRAWLLEPRTDERRARGRS